jgi:signal transduction histidine kinase
VRLIHNVLRLPKARLQVFLAAHLATYCFGGVLLPLGEYIWLLRSPWLLAIAAMCTAQCVVLGIALRLARRGRYQRSLTLACIGNWATVLLVTYIWTNLLPVLVLLTLTPVLITQAFFRWQRGLVFAVVTAGCVLSLTALARFQQVSHLDAHALRAIESALIIVGLPAIALHILVIAWNNAAALRSSETMLAERATQLEASRSRLITAADDERRRLECDLHDGAQQHLVALAVLLQLARSAEDDKYEPLLTEAAGLLENAIAEIRRLANGIYPPLLVGGGLAEALPAVAARAPIPVQVDLQGLGRYPAPIEAALYFCCSEALQNAAKHGGPGTTVKITAHADEATLSLAITDTGRGFDTATIGTGLTNMTDRLSAIGGDLVIDTAPERGTRVIAVVAAPVKRTGSELPAVIRA